MQRTNEGNTLYSILNMENLLNGGLKTEYGLYALAVLAKSGINGYPKQAAHILAEFSHVNLKQLNEQHDTNQVNEEQILSAMFDVANGIVKADPKLKDQVRSIMKLIREKNPELPKTKPENAFLMNLGIQQLWERTQGRQ